MVHTSSWIASSCTCAKDDICLFPWEQWTKSMLLPLCKQGVGCLLQCSICKHSCRNPNVSSILSFCSLHPSSWVCHPLHCSCSVNLGHFWVTWLSVAKLGSVAGRFCLVAGSRLFLQWSLTHAVFWRCLMVWLWSMLRWMQPGTPVVDWFQLHFSWTHRFLQLTKPVLNAEPIFLRQSKSLGHVLLFVSLFLNHLNWRLTLLSFGTWFSTRACHHRSVCCQTLLCHCIQMKM